MTQPAAQAMVTKKLTHSRGHKCAHDLANRDLEESQKQVLKRYEKDFELFFTVNLYFFEKYRLLMFNTDKCIKNAYNVTSSFLHLISKVGLWSIR